MPPTVPEHLYYIMLELLKNALRAVMDRHGHGTSPPPSVRVLLSRDYSLTEGAQIVIRVSDEGTAAREERAIGRSSFYICRTCKASGTSVARHRCPHELLLLIHARRPPSLPPPT